MSRVPAACAGETAVILVSDTTVKRVAATVPKVTVVAPVKPVPVMVTSSSPDVGPEVGATPVTVGTEDFVCLTEGLWVVVDEQPAITAANTAIDATRSGAPAVLLPRRSSFTFRVSHHPIGPNNSRSRSRTPSPPVPVATSRKTTGLSSVAAESVAGESVAAEVVDEDLGDGADMGEEAEVAGAGDLRVFGARDRRGRLAGPGRR